MVIYANPSSLPTGLGPDPARRPASRRAMSFSRSTATRWPVG